MRRKLGVRRVDVNLDGLAGGRVLQDGREVRVDE